MILNIVFFFEQNFYQYYQSLTIWYVSSLIVSRLNWWKNGTTAEHFQIPGGWGRVVITSTRWIFFKCPMTPVAPTLYANCFFMTLSMKPLIIAGVSFHQTGKIKIRRLASFKSFWYFLTLGSLVLPALNKESSRVSYAGLKLSQYRSIAENSSFLLLRFVELLWKLRGWSFYRKDERRLLMSSFFFFSL